MKAASPVRGGAVGKGLSLDTTWDKTGKSEKTQHLAGRLLYYDLGEPLPDHSSLTRIRERYGVEVFRRFFEAIVEQCQQAGLVWGVAGFLEMASNYRMGKKMCLSSC